MRKIISLLLSVAMMLLLSVSIFATTATSMTVDFDPILDADIPTEVDRFDTSVGSSNDKKSKICFRLTGADIINEFEGTSFYESSDLLVFSLDYTFNHTTYQPQEYLFVFSCELPADTTIDENTTITATNGDSGTYILTDDDKNAYFYIKFTPRSGSDNNSGGEPPVSPYGSDTLENVNSSKNIDVTVTYDNSVIKPPVYSVVITWGSMDFTYQPASDGIWDPEEHKYSDATLESWNHEDNANAITVTNHSNAAITAEFTFTPDNAYQGIVGTFQDSNSQPVDNPKSIASADNESGTQVIPSFTAFLNLSGTLNNKDADHTRCGYVTVTISE